MVVGHPDRKSVYAWLTIIGVPDYVQNSGSVGLLEPPTSWEMGWSAPLPLRPQKGQSGVFHNTRSEADHEQDFPNGD